MEAKGCALKNTKFGIKGFGIYIELINLKLLYEDNVYILT